MFVSPLRRALQTAYHSLKTHPNFDKIRFIVHPLLRGKINSIWEIPANINDTIEKYSQLFPHFDTSLIMTDCPAEAKRADFYVYSLPEQVRDKILEEMKTKDAA